MKASRLVVGGLASVVLVVLLLGHIAARDGSAAPAQVAAARVAAEKPFVAHDVVIVWCGGIPDAPPMPAPDAGAVDAVTQSTPKIGNIQEAAEKLGKELEAAGHSVLVITAEDCRDPRHIIQAKAVVLGCPDYFSLPPWQMVRFFDETLYRLYRARPRIRLNERVVTAFATTDRCLAILERILGSPGGKAVEGAVISARGTSAADREASIKQLAERIAAGL